MLQIGLKPLMKLFQSHAVYNGKEICYRDFIHKVKIELLKEKLVNNPPPPQNAAKKYLLRQRDGLHFMKRASSTK